MDLLLDIVSINKTHAIAIIQYIPGCSSFLNMLNILRGDIQRLVGRIFKISVVDLAMSFIILSYNMNFNYYSAIAVSDIILTCGIVTSTTYKCKELLLHNCPILSQIVCNIIRLHNSESMCLKAYYTQ